ncbi:hypothetical protein [Tepidibacillus fermentans]|uniref:Uncharacterized protein n=1 Tax=Tepidibacillus fermentans TaxID=1281767 RepID=A0A4R3K9E6_9BACI|nr:hypothetical protein [Tepidibacillus fermentans]TCS79548.1 hypothetical protein EDD72_1206 [Tepidibacillus fermentans]
MNQRVSELTRIALLASFIAVTGMIKIPTGFPGSEFQLSAPLAVAIVVTFGFWRYFIAGLIASSVLFMLGLHTILNVEVAILFRLVAGGIIALFRTSLGVILIAGPIGSLIARIGLAYTLQIEPLPLILTAIPGMIYTVITVYPLTKVLQRANKVVWRSYESV